MLRREFLAAMIGSRFAVRGWRKDEPGRRAPSPAHLAPIGVQLYTLRDAMRANPEDTLARIAQIGYREIEWWGEFGRTPAQIRRLLDEHHLTSPSAHFGIEALEGDAAGATIEAAHVMGHHYLVVASTPPETQGTLDGWRRIADRFNAAAERLHREGFQFAYHNHDYEFKAIEGRIPFDVLCESTDRRLVQLEVDLYWMITAGADPLAFFRHWPGRVPLVHVKDRTAAGRMVDVGAGAIDWRAIFRERKRAGIRHYFVEHDEPADPFASIRASYDYLSRLAV